MPLLPVEARVVGMLLAQVFCEHDELHELTIDWPVEYAQFRHFLEHTVLLPYGKTLWNLLRFIRKWPFFEELLLELIDAGERADPADLALESGETMIPWRENLAIIGEHLAKFPLENSWEEFAEARGYALDNGSACAARS